MNRSRTAALKFLPVLRGPPNHAMASSVAEEAPKPFSDMPAVKGWPIVGTLPYLLKSLKSMTGGDEHIYHKYQSKLGPIFKLKMIGKEWLVVTSSPESAEVAFRAEGKYPSRGSYESNMIWIYDKMDAPQTMFFSNGEKWRKIRSSASKQVVPRRVGNFVGPLCNFTEEFLAHLESIKNESGNDFIPEINKWALQGISYFVYGEKINIYSEADPVQKEFMEAGLDFIRSITHIAFSLPWYRLFPTKPYRDYVGIVKRMHRAGKHILDKRFSEIKDAISSGIVDDTKPVGLLDQWLIEGRFTEEEALSLSCDMLAAGIDTTASSASFLLYEIAKQPELQERLVEEISSVVAQKEHPSWDDLQKMSLVRNCVKETMRMYVPTATVPRVINEEVVLNGYRVPAGTTVFFNMHTASRDGTIFKDPNIFKPDRWSKDADEKINPFSSLPFGFGPRSCYGRRLAELELYILLTKMLPKYRLATNITDMKLKLEVVLKPDLPLTLTFQERKK